MPVLLACILMIVACAILLGLVSLLLYAVWLTATGSTAQLDYGSICAMLVLV